jgi:hypothetical protein
MEQQMSARDPLVEEKAASPSGGNPLAPYGWLSVYYREAASAPGFHAKDDAERWELLRNRVLLGPPKDDGLRQRAIDTIPRDTRTQILRWLQFRELSGM